MSYAPKTRKVVHLCDLDYDTNWTKVNPGMQPGECPNEAQHEAAPLGHIAWHTWAEGMMKTHTQELCPGCNRWSIYKLKTLELANV